MKSRIENYINRIDYYENVFDQKSFLITDEFIFHGDGVGDFEEWSKEASKESIEKYIEYLENQIELVKRYLNSK